MQNQAQISKIKEDQIALLRALTGDENLQIEFDEECKSDFASLDQNLISQSKKIILPFSKSEISANRAALDLALCYFLFHDSKTHSWKKFAEEEQKFFDEFEKARVIVNVENIYLGSLKNILRKLENEPYSSATISLLLFQHFFPQEIPPKTKNLIAEIEKKTSRKISNQIKKLAENISNQEVFALEVQRLLELLKEESELKNSQEDEQKKDQENKKEKEDLNSFGQENIDENEEKKFEQDGEESANEIEQKEENIAELKDGEANSEASLKRSNSEAAKEEIEFKNLYKIFTSQFDEVVFPQKLILKKELEILYDQLELKLTKLADISRKSSLKFKKKLLSKRNAPLEFDATRGVLNRKKLTRLILDPMLDDVWINNREHEYQDTALTILLDNSGSMRGAPIVMSALACKMIAEILEKFSVKTEIIGFTTADWKGGRARKLWEANGRKKNPGRLNELRHIIYKQFNQSFKKSKINLGLMLKEGILKENIDGEALLFARSRLMQQSEKRKILMVISDGTPIDDSTLATNDSDILSDHLHHVVNKIEKAGRVEIIGIGIGHDTSDFYRNSMAIKNLEELSDAMIEKIAAIL